MPRAQPEPENDGIPEFVVLPHLPDNILTSNQRKAQNIIRQVYESAWSTLHASDSDPFRLRLLSNQLLGRVIPILQALEHEMPTHKEWITEMATKVAEIIVELEGSAAEAELIRSVKLSCKYKRAYLFAV